MVVGQCGGCGLVQLTTPPPPDIVRPPHPVSYREPEAHLDDLVQQMLAMLGAATTSRFCGLTYKDATTLDRLRDLGCQNTKVLDAVADLGIDDATAGLETIQQRLTVGAASELASRAGTFDFVIARHIAEHAHDTAMFFAAAAKLLAPGGYLVVEVPDSADSLRTCDYTMMWEEHVAYFTTETLADTLLRCGYRVVKSIVYPYAQENSLIAIAQLAGEDRQAATTTWSQPKGAASYGERFQQVREQWRQKLSDLRRTSGPVAIFGAGHRTVAFIHLIGLSDLIDFVVDEAEHKIGLYLPGTVLQISPPSVFATESLGACLLTTPLQYEDNVIERYPQVREKGGGFFSIFPESPHAMFRHSEAAV